jgi:hypothetical protein
MNALQNRGRAETREPPSPENGDRERTGPYRSAVDQSTGLHWRGVSVPPARDIRRLLPPSMPRRQRFERLREAETRNLARVEILANRGSAIADALYECDATSPCDLPACARCARRYRIYFTSEALAVADAYLGPHEFATVFLDAVEAGSLPDASLKRAHAALRKRLDRSGFKGSVLVGGTEAAWNAADRRWILHLHLLAIGVRPDSWDGLRAKLGDFGHAVPLKVEALNDEARQLSYITKFTTYHRPLRRGPGGPSRAFPLPPARLEELATWWARHCFEDFAFLYGARRRGGRIALEV